jgi:hypothetical protein
LQQQGRGETDDNGGRQWRIISSRWRRESGERAAVGTGGKEVMEGRSWQREAGERMAIGTGGKEVMEGKRRQRRSFRV